MPRLPQRAFQRQRLVLRPVRPPVLLLVPLERVPQGRRVQLFVMQLPQPRHRLKEPVEPLHVRLAAPPRPQPPLPPVVLLLVRLGVALGAGPRVLEE